MSASSVRIEGDVKKLLKQLKKLENSDETIRAATKILAQSIRSSTVMRFKKEQSPDNKTWEPSSRSMRSEGKTLTDKGQLKKSIRAKSTQSGFAVGTNLVYASTHQYGAERTIRAKTSKGLRFYIGGRWVNKKKVRIKIPARPYLGLSEEDMKEIRDTLLELMGAQND